MSTFRRACSAAVLLAATSAAQSTIPSYKSYEDYCYQNPHAPTCIDGKPITLDDVTKNAKAWSDATKPLNQQPLLTTQQAPARHGAEPRREAVLPKRPATRFTNFDLRFAHPKPDVLIGIDIQSVLSSEFLREAFRQFASNFGAKLPAGEDVFAHAARVRGAVISVSKKDFLALVAGDVDSLMAQKRPKGYAIKRIAPDTVLIGSEGSLEAAVARMNTEAPAVPQYERARELARLNDIWISGSLESIAALDPEIAAAGGSSPIKNFSLGMTFLKDLRFQLELEATDAAGAARLLDSFKKSSMRGVRATLDGNSVRCAITIDHNRLDRLGTLLTDKSGPFAAFAQKFSALQPGAVVIQGQETRQQPREQPREQPSSHPGKAVILGLDDGPREVPLSPKP